MQKSVILPGGPRIIGDTWEEIEGRIRDAQFSTYDSPEEFRKDMQHRAWVWSQTEIEINGDSQDFLWELSRAQLLEVSLAPLEPASILKYRKAHSTVSDKENTTENSGKV